MIPIPVRNASIVYSKGQNGYIDVIDSFNSAKYINIVTYNIVFHNNMGLQQLLNVSPCCRIRIVTNIPHKPGEKVTKTILNSYLDKLKPERFNNNTSVYFNFQNHSKIIMTDSIAYIGSANFSNSKFHEFGLLVNDNEAIQQLDRVVRHFCENSKGYYSNIVQNKLKHLIHFSQIDKLLIKKLIILCERADKARFLRHNEYQRTGIPGLIDFSDIIPEDLPEEIDIEQFLYSLDMNQIKMVHYVMYLGRDYFIEDFESDSESISQFFEDYEGISHWTDKHKEIEHVMNKSARLSVYLKRGLMMIDSRRK